MRNLKKSTFIYTSIALALAGTMSIASANDASSDLAASAASTLASAQPSATAAATSNQRGFTIEDLVNMERIGSPVLSPNGQYVVYSLRSTDLDKNRGRTDLWLIDLNNANATPKQLTNNANGDGNNFSPSWSANGDAVYFMSTRSGSAQVWRLALNETAASKVTDLPLDVESYRVSPTNNRIAMSLSVFRDCADLACTKDRLEANAKLKETGKTYKQLFIRHWDTWSDGRRNVLYSAELNNQHLSADPVSLSGDLDGDVHSKPDGDQEEYNFSPDGNSVVFAARVAGKTEPWSTNFDLYKVPATGGASPINLTADNKAWDTKPAFSPDGKTLAYLAMKRPGFEADRFQIVLMDVQTGKKHFLTDKWDRSATQITWSEDGKTIYTSAADVGQVRLFAIDVASGAVKALSEQGTVASYDVRGNSMIIAQNNLASDAQIFHSAVNAPSWKQVTHANAQLLNNIKFGEYEQFSFAGHKGEKVHGYVMKPWNAKEGEKYPIAFIVHGGPQGSMSNGWSYRWNPQVYAGAGYGVVFIDFHGSTGYGQAFTDSISGDWGGKPLEDLKKGMAAASKKFPWLDTNRSCALGASYGGYMMNWIAGNWNDGFKCIVNHAGVFDTRAMFYTTEELWFTEWENGGTAYDVPAKYEKFNPMNFVKKWKTPTLVTQGEKDFRIPSTQSFAAFTALQRRGIESELLVFPDENHHILKPANSLQWHHTVLNWLGKHLTK